MIIQAYDTIDRVVKVRITGKLVEYSDSVDYPTYLEFSRLIKNEEELAKWEERLQALDTEEDIAKEVSDDMKKFGHKLIEEFVE